MSRVSVEQNPKCVAVSVLDSSTYAGANLQSFADGVRGIRIRNNTSAKTVTMKVNGLSTAVYTIPGLGSITIPDTVKVTSIDFANASGSTVAIEYDYTVAQ